MKSIFWAWIGKWQTIYSGSMKIGKKAFLFLCLSFRVAAFPADAKGYRIFGNVIGFADSTRLYLSYPAADGIFSHIDSTYVVHGRFVFTGEIKMEFVRAMVGTKDFTNSKSFWLENMDFLFNSQNQNLGNAIVRSAGMQKDENELDSLIHSGKDQKEAYYSFISLHPNSIISARLLNEYDLSWGRDTTAVLYHSLSRKSKSSTYGKTVREYLTINKNLRIGDKYVDFYETDPDDKKVYVSDFKGKVILIEFWGSWCGACRAKNPELVSIYNEFKAKGFEILGVAAETSKDAWVNAIMADKLPWKNITDFKGGDNEAGLMYGVWYYPSNFLIDRQGIIIGKDFYGDRLRKKIRELL